MKKAFFFDMDGVLADSETAWEKLGYEDLLKEHFGAELYAKVKIAPGLSIKRVFDAYASAGWKGEYQSFHEANMKMALRIYDSIPLTPGLEDLIEQLAAWNFEIGVVSSSPREWVDVLISRIKNKSKIALILSVNNHKTLRSKPEPDPYLYAMKTLEVDPDNTYILEDSIPGVTSGKAAGATVICLTAYHAQISQELPNNADYYASTMKEVQDIVDNICSK